MRIIALAHQTETMARQNPLKPLGFYLRGDQGSADPRAAGSSQVAAMLKRMEAEGKRVKITRVAEPRR